MKDFEKLYNDLVDRIRIEEMKINKEVNTPQYCESTDSWYEGKEDVIDDFVNFIKKQNEDN
jgi:hypothetical protein